ncbi:hypothetical protein ACXR0O_15130 [Verrucomicrobiota bacterium sgz303538]
MKLFRRTVVAALLQATLMLATRAEEFVAPPRVADQVNRVLGSAAEEAPLAKNPVDFLDALGVLHRLVDRETAAAAQQWEGGSMTAKVIWLAEQHSAHPQRLDEIHKYYFKDGLKNGPQFDQGIRPHIYLGPELRETHANEEYRAAWEALALLRNFESSLDRNDHLLMMALATIGNAKSAPVIGYRCNPAGRETGAEPADELYALAALPDSETLRVILRVLGEWRKARPDLFKRLDRIDNIPGLSPVELSPREAMLAEAGTMIARTCEALERRSSASREIAEKWRSAFKSFPSESLTPPDRKVFDLLAAAVAEPH